MVKKLNVEDSLMNKPFHVVTLTEVSPGPVGGMKHTEEINEIGSQVSVLDDDFAAAVSAAKKLTQRDGKDRVVMIRQILRQTQITPS